MPLKTDIVIRRAERDDLDTVVEWMADPDFTWFLYGDATRSPKQIREQVVGMIGRTSGQTMPGGIYLIIDSKREGPLGFLSIQKLSWRNRSCDIDLYIGKKALRNRLVAAMAAFRAVAYCFDELNLHRVGAIIYAFNSASWRLFEKLGAVRELTLRDHVPRDGQRYDAYGYGLLRPEYDAFCEAHRPLIARSDLGPPRRHETAGPPPTATEAPE
ncbi:MAG TPA: GNAT family protein [Candidatus Hydrogenedentes bacterium]|nr:GNAT family protein [Candidatus Hydrogenedentota bacterium]HPG66225.1 GNAT family protein [Candidatus Hydrogenedentota bacterium]